eukprot:TRINITY_DN78240_c0_g1_i1.p1 TRINITY_DN78240_c0_g1~~TRINITY_DN78240_c0_g1_i1.p1  ORF type:complete len:279 (+),score=52.34 TRINITY_DN78240_c0_g1_i1:69-839(+)
MATEPLDVGARRGGPAESARLREKLASEPGLYDNLVTSIWLDWKNLQHCPDDVKSDREVVMSAVHKSNGEAFQYASEELRSNPDVVMEVMKMNGLCLQYASEKLRGDREFVLKACAFNGYALKYASDELKDDREVVMVAVRNTGGALQHASDNLLGDLDLLFIATEPDVAPTPKVTLTPAQVWSNEQKAFREAAKPPDRTQLAVERLPPVDCHRGSAPSDYDLLLASFDDLGKQLEELKVETEKREEKFAFLEQVW